MFEPLGMGCLCSVWTTAFTIAIFSMAWWTCTVMRRCCYLFMERNRNKRKEPNLLFYSMSSQNHFDAEKVHLDTNEANPNVNHILHSRSKWTKYTRHRQQQQIWKGSKSNSIAVFVRLKNLIKVLDKIVSQRPVPKCWILDWHSSQFNAKNMLLDTMRLCNRTTKPSRFICFST